MAAPFFDLQSKTEAALKVVVDTVSLTNRGNAVVIVGLDGVTDLVLPRIVVEADSAGQEDPPLSGNFQMTAAVLIYSDADVATALAAHRSRLAYVMDALFVDTLAASLTAAVADFTCIGVLNRRWLPQRKEDRHFLSELQFDLIVCPQDFAN